MTQISYSSPAKIILSGEHSVVYGKPAFVTAIDLRLTVTIEAGEKGEKHQAVDHIEELVLSYLRKAQKIEKKPFSCTITSDILIGRGMGSSAAFCVATVAALLHFYSGKEFNKQTINSLAYQAEKFFHGMPSGVDVSASCFGGLIFYRKEFEFLKHISSLNFKIPQPFQDNLFLIDSGKPAETTAEMVKAVGKRYNDMPKEMEQTLMRIEKITKRMVISIVKEDVQMFAESIADNQKELEDLGIISKPTKQLLKQLSPFGVGKVTGAGGLKEGSGMILFLAQNKKELGNYLKKQNIEYVSFKQDFEGVRIV
ncbi:MAG TPA: mevalonate kinase [Candidatus Woesebacteria bacterium]|nr:mevalonate kinase [Candidatus Woesebacteria bacterium]